MTQTDTSVEELELIVRRHGPNGRLGHLELNRPRAMNALTFPMVQQIDETLADWAEDPTIESVLITGAGERGLCAGGDIVSVARSKSAGRDAEAERFFFVEYGMNHRISTFPKPYVAFMDGIVLGGGLGVSAHGSHRIVTEKTRIGMPEVGIGFTPDVGMSYLLSRAPEFFGLHLALTGTQASGADAIMLGLADSFVPSDELPELFSRLQTTSPQEAIAAHARSAPEPDLEGSREWIERCYGQSTLPEIINALTADDDEAARAAGQRLSQVSPTALAVTYANQQRLRTVETLPGALAQEYRAGLHLMHGHDMMEGIRAQMIDKDRSPRWDPATLAEVSQDHIDSHFTPPASGDWELPGH